MMLFDIFAGMNQNNINSLFADMYKILYPSLFKVELDTTITGIKSVAVDIQTAPVCDTAIRDAIRNFATEALAEIPGFLTNTPDEDIEKILSDTLNRTVYFEAKQLTVQVTTEEGEVGELLQASMSGCIAVCASRIGDKDGVAFHLSRAKIEIPGDKTLAKTLNDEFVNKALLTHLNEKILDKMRVPVFQFNSMSLKAPVTLVDEPCVVAFFALNDSRNDRPAAGPNKSAWPETACLSE